MEKSILNVNELVAYTGLSKSYLYKLTMWGILPHSKPLGKMLFFDKKEIDEFFLSKKVACAKQTQQRATNYVTLKQRGAK